MIIRKNNTPFQAPVRWSTTDIQHMRDACKAAAEALQQAGTLVRAGVTTDEIDHAVHAHCMRLHVYPSPLRYLGFPKSCCTSVNNVVCHGIPDDRALRDGDIVNIDVSVYHRNGFHGDCSQTFLVGSVDEKGRKLVQDTHDSLLRGIRVCGPKQRFSAIGSSIEAVANSRGYTVCDRFIGHGIGRHFHQGPQIFHTRNTSRQTMDAGMIFTIEPILNQGSSDVDTWSDGWTAVTADGGRSAQWEHTILVTPDVCGHCIG